MQKYGYLMKPHVGLYLQLCRYKSTKIISIFVLKKII